MAFSNTILATLPAFVGGEEETYYYRSDIQVDGVFTAEDLTGYVYTIEIIWEGCVKLCLSEGDGITRLTDAPAIPDDEAEGVDANYHFKWTITEEQGCYIPIGKTPVKIKRESPDGVTTIDAVNILRTL